MDTLFLSAFGLGIAFCAPPGAITAEALRRGLARGFRPALLLELGSLIGDAAWAALALAGAAIVVQNRAIQIVLGAAGSFSCCGWPGGRCAPGGRVARRRRGRGCAAGISVPGRCCRWRIRGPSPSGWGWAGC